MKFIQWAVVLMLFACAAGAQSAPHLKSPRTVPGLDGQMEDEPEDPGPALQPIAVNDCRYHRSFGPEFDLYRNTDGWKLYTIGTGEGRDSNNTVLCVFDRLGIFVPGIVGAGPTSVRVEAGPEGRMLRILAVGPAADKDGRRLLRASQLRDVSVKGDRLVRSSGPRSITIRNLDFASEYFIPLDGLEDRIKSGRGLTLANVTKVARTTRTADFPSASEGKFLTVFVHPKDDVAAILRTSVLRYAAQTSCTAGRDIPKTLAAYFRNAAADPELARAFAALDSSDANMLPPSVVFSCKSGRSAAYGDWDLAVPSWNKSRALEMKNGKILARSGY
jgi:hypothetical protein